MTSKRNIFAASFETKYFKPYAQTWQHWPLGFSLSRSSQFRGSHSYASRLLGPPKIINASGLPSGPLLLLQFVLVLAPVGLACAFSPSWFLLLPLFSLGPVVPLAPSVWCSSSVVRWPSTSVCSPCHVPPVRVPWLLSSWTGSSAVSFPVSFLVFLAPGSG